MPSRAIWKGVVALGAIRPAVKLHTAVRSRPISFNMLHDQDMVRLRQQMYCGLENEPVSSEHIVRGYPLEQDEYAILDEGELRALDPPPSRDIDVLDFVPAGSVDGRYMDRTYWLAPDQDRRPLDALIEAMQTTSTVAICKWVMRNKSYVGVLGSMWNAASLVTLRAADDVIAASSLFAQSAQLKTSLDKREIQTARYLINTMAGEFDPSQYRDEFQQKLQDLIQKKIAGEPMPAGPAPQPAPTPEANLLEQLQKSLQEARQRRGHAPKRARRAG